jgi:peptidyl-prolyl cis-trans isomerase B (cyclophilin B)
MAPTRERQQRAAARARLEREMTARAEAARKRRQRNTYIAAGLAVVVVVAGGAWLGVKLTHKHKKPAATTAAASGCKWIPDDPSANKNLKDVGKPPTDVPRSGKQILTLDTTQGKIAIEMNVTGAPCTSASMAYLASQKFFDGSTCHREVTEGFKILQCGDPTATGSGGPSYKMAEENLPTGQNPAYQRGVVAMAKTQEPSSTGSQFFLVDADIPLSDGQSTGGLTADYTILGTITSGMDVLDKVIKAGAVDPTNPKKAAGDGKPKLEVKIKTATAGDVVAQ